MRGYDEELQNHQLRDLTSILGEAKPLPYWEFPREHQDLVTHQYAIWSNSYHNSLYEMDLSFYKAADEVAPGLWIGNRETALDPEFYTKNNIDAVLNMAIEIAYAVPLGVLPVKIGIHDGEIVPEGAFTKAAQEIDDLCRRGKKVLVHCAAGVSRSVTAVIAYLMLTQGMTFRGALDHIRERRPQANPHHLLIRSLVRDLGNRFIK